MQRYILATLTKDEWMTVAELAEGIPGKSLASRKEKVRCAIHLLAREGLVKTELRGLPEWGPVELGARLL